MASDQMMSTDEFRAKAKAFLEENAERFDSYPDGKPRSFSMEESKAFQKKLQENGLAALLVPQKYGGAGLSPEHLIVWNELAGDYNLPTGPFMIGQNMPGNTILTLGTEEQKERWLPTLYSGEHVWCQLFSEPDGGSDVASLQTRATKTESGTWLINGQKVWTSGAQFSDFGTIIVRTDPTVPKHAGITMFVVDMHHPGVTVRPLKVATGASPFNEVFFEDVEVHDDDIIGGVNNGWNSAVVMLRFERVTIGTGARYRTNPLGYDNLAARAKELGLTSDPAVRRKLAEVYAREISLRAYGKVLHSETMIGNEMGAKGSAAKLAGAEYNLWAGDVAQEIFGAPLALGDERLRDIALGIMGAPGGATAGGSNEIQRNIVAERVLGLSKDPGVDKTVPFNELKFSRNQSLPRRRES